MHCSGCCCDTCLSNTEGKLRAATDAWNDTAKTSDSWFSGADNSTGPRSVTEPFRQLLKIPLDLDHYIFSFALLQEFVNMVVSNMCCYVRLLSELLHKALTQSFWCTGKIVGLQFGKKCERYISVKKEITIRHKEYMRFFQHVELPDT